MRSPRGVAHFVLLGLLAFVCSSVFAVWAGLGRAQAKADFEQAHEQLSNAHQMLTRNASLFGPNMKSNQKSDLKSQVQQSCARNSVPLVFVNETERDAGDKLKERNVTARMANVRHDGLVAFLIDLEERAAPAHVRELRIKTSNSRSDLYSEAEAVLTSRYSVQAPLGTGKEAPK